MALQDPSRLIGHTMNCLRDRQQGSGIRECVSGAFTDSLFPRRPERPEDLSNAGNCLVLFAGALGYAVFPHARRRPRADSLSVSTPLGAWPWAANQIRGNVRDSSWRHAGSLRSHCGYIHMGHSTNGQLPFSSLFPTLHGSGVV